MNRRFEEIDGIHHGDTRYKGLNPLTDIVMLKEGLRTLVAPHASSVCFSKQLGHIFLFL
jgi:hypothetical protein